MVIFHSYVSLLEGNPQMVGFFHCHVSFPEGEFTQAAVPAVPAKDQGAHVGGIYLEDRSMEVLVVIRIATGRTVHPFINIDWLVVWNMNFIFHNIWDNPSH